MATKKTYRLGDVVTFKSTTPVDVHTPDDRVLHLQPSSGAVQFVVYTTGEYTIGLADGVTTVKAG